MNQPFTKGTSMARFVFPLRLLNGSGANTSAMPCMVFSVYRGASLANGSHPSGSAKSSSSSSKVSARKRPFPDPEAPSDDRYDAMG